MPRGDEFLFGRSRQAKSARRTGARAAAFAALLVAALFACGPAFAAAQKELLYHVKHAIFGDIGTYSNTIEKSAGVTTVLTQAQFRVRILGIPLRSENGRHIEKWVKNRLVYFHGVTDKGGKPFEVTGKAKGNSFIIHSALGKIVAPASVHPANPWSSNFLDSRTMMRVDTGKLETVRVTGSNPARVPIDGEAVPAREYKLVGKTKYWIWLDDAGVPVKFKVDDNTGMITFTLARCAGCALDGRYAARR